MNKENVPQPRVTIRPTYRGKRRDIRHHNPGTHRRPPTPRVRVLSSITVVPPREVNLPVASTSAIPDHDPIWSMPPPMPPPAPWVTPPDIEEPPKPSTPLRRQNLIPTTEIKYDEEFRIVPGEAYESVPLYINRDVAWKLRPIDAPVQRRVRRYRSDISDPRLHNLRVEVTPCDSLSPPPERIERLFASPRRPMEPTTTPTDVLGDLVQLLDQTYGCPRPKAQPNVPPTPQPVPQSSCGEATRLSESLEALVRLARLFAPQDLNAIHRRYKRPQCAARK